MPRSKGWSRGALRGMLMVALAAAAGPSVGADSADANSADAAAPRTVTVHVVAQSTGADGAAGGSCKAVRVTAGPSDDGQPRVGFFESQVGGTGDQWRSAGWMASVTASMLLDFDPRTARVSFDYQGVVDGPSAGAVLTCAVLAAARGDAVRDDAAMTGTINPDGSIGPVGGILHKIDGAARAGMKLLVIPAGIRFERNDDGQLVDLLEYGQDSGVEVRNVFDVYEAYRLLTGVQLPRPNPASPPRVSLEVQRGIKSKIGEWTARYTHAFEAFDKLPGEAKHSQQVDALYDAGVANLKTCKELLTEGEFTAAWWDAVIGAASCYLGLETARCRQTYAATGYQGVVARLRDNGWLDKHVQATMRRMQDETPKTLDQLSVYLVCCEAFLEGLSLQRLAKARLAGLPDEESEAAIALCAAAAEAQILAWFDVILVNDYLDLQEKYQGRPIPPNAPWRETASYLQHAAGANLAVFDALVVAERANAKGQTVEQTKNALMLEDKDYGIVRAATDGLFPNLRDYFGEGDALGYAYLATSIYTHHRAAALVAKYYSLGAKLNDAARVTEVAQERTLGEWLTYAEDQSRRNIALLQESGVDATACAQMHSIARIKARRDLAQKLEGLVEFWSADAHARVLRCVSGLALAARTTTPAEQRASGAVKASPLAR